MYVRIKSTDHLGSEGASFDLAERFHFSDSQHSPKPAFYRITQSLSINSLSGKLRLRRFDY